MEIGLFTALLFQTVRVFGHEGDLPPDLEINTILLIDCSCFIAVDRMTKHLLGLNTHSNQFTHGKYFPSPFGFEHIE